MKRYCENCGKEVSTKIVLHKETYNVCGEPIEVEDRVLVCSDCGEDFYCEELDNTTLISAYNEYRKKHKLLLPEEIKMIREQYGLSQRSFAKLLNWGDKTIFRYENGSIQDKAHNSLLLFLREPVNMRTYLLENEVTLDSRQLKKLLATVDSLQENATYRVGRQYFHHLFFKSPCLENGFRVFDYDKFCAMVLFFAHKSKGLLKTKLMKLLNYSDMIFFRDNGISISGMRYAHLPYGPVPENHDILFGAMAADHIAHVEVVFENGYEKHLVIPDVAMMEGVLSDEELSTMEQIYQKFVSFGSVEISNYSHRERGYSETKTGDIIPYSYAKDIRLDN